MAGIYAGVRPERISHFVNLEGFGLPLTRPEQAPARYAKWLDELREPPLMRAYPNKEAVAARLVKTNPRISASRADFWPVTGLRQMPRVSGRFSVIRRTRLPAPPCTARKKSWPAGRRLRPRIVGGGG